MGFIKERTYEKDFQHGGCVEYGYFNKCAYFGRRKQYKQNCNRRGKTVSFG